MQTSTSRSVLFPEKLKTGDKVRLVSPASAPNEPSVFRIRDGLENWGLKVELADHVFSRQGYLAGSDADRLSDLNQALRDPSVRAVIATAGGKGSYRIADQIDFGAAQADPKFLVGFSDISILHLSLWKQSRVVAIHGALFDTDDGQSLQRALMTDSDIKVSSRPSEVTSKLTTHGKAHGPLIGGNLDMVATAAGWCLPNLRGAILLLEAVNQGIGAIDRQLSMLRKAGHLSGLAGVAVGQFTDISEEAIDMVHQHLEALDVPVLGGLPLGHGDNPECIFVGAPADLDADASRLVATRSGG